MTADRTRRARLCPKIFRSRRGGRVFGVATLTVRDATFTAAGVELTKLYYIRPQRRNTTLEPPSNIFRTLFIDKLRMVVVIIIKSMCMCVCECECVCRCAFLDERGWWMRACIGNGAEGEERGSLVEVRVVIWFLGLDGLWLGIKEDWGWILLACYVGRQFLYLMFKASVVWRRKFSNKYSKFNIDFLRRSFLYANA